jgi:Cu-Zn family superoxide dismutase
MRRTTTFSLALLVALIAFSLTSAAKTVVEMKDSQGNSVGTAVFSSQGDQLVRVELNLHGLPPGVHAIHVHETAKCEAPDFKSAGPHFNPDHKKHGLENPEGHHAGDLNNITVDAKGNVKVKFTIPNVTLDADDPHSLFRNGGTSLVIHAKADDMKTDPAGNSGDRIACGVITK